MVHKLDLVIDGTTKEGLREGATEIAKSVRADWDHDKLQFKVWFGCVLSVTARSRLFAFCKEYFKGGMTKGS